MNGSLWLWGVLAVTAFWGVGVYNRLMRMQVRGMAALRSVVKHMHRCVRLVDGHANYVAERPALDRANTTDALAESWAHVLQSAYDLNQTLADAKSTPLASQSVAQVGCAFEAAQDTWRQWCDVQLVSDADTESENETVRIQWDEATLKVQAARQGLNQILTKYNEAIAQFPARLLVKLMGFRPAGLM